MLKKIFLAFLVVVFLGAGYRVWNTRQNKDATASGKNTEKSQTGSQPSFDKTKYSLSDPSSTWVVINKNRALKPIDYTPNDLQDVGGGQQLRKEAAQAFAKLTSAAAKDQMTIQPLSGYRSYATQIAVYNSEVSRYGQATADSQSARPGRSEHQTGLAIDIGGGGCGIEDCFGNTNEGRWVAKNAYKYGFIIRYPTGKEAITGYRAEPWHIRYVGVSLAVELNGTGVKTLEEFFDIVERQPY